jgi:hypothetical protein
MAIIVRFYLRILIATTGFIRTSFQPQIQCQIIEEITLLINSGRAISAFGDCKGEDFGSRLEWNFINFFQTLPDIMSSAAQNEVVGSAENYGPSVQGFGSFVYSIVSRESSSRVQNA